MRLFRDSLVFFTENLPKMNIISFAGYHMREGGLMREQDLAFTITNGIAYLVSERKLGFFVKVKEDQNFNRRNTLSILRIKIFI